MRKLLFTSVGLGLVVIFAIGLLMGKERVISTFSMANLRYLAIAIGFELLSVLALMGRWKVVVDDAGMDVSTWKLLQITFAGISISNLTPSARTGGEAARSYFLNKETGRSTKETLATIIAERIFDMAFFILITFIGIVSAVFLFHLPIWVLSILLLICVLGVFGILLIVYTVTSETFGLKIGIWLINKLERLIKKFKPLKEAEEKFKQDFREHSENLKTYLKKPGLWLKSMSMSGVMWVFDILRAYFVFLAIGLEVHPVLIISLIVLSQTAGLIPFLPGGLGSVETVRLVILSTAGVALAGAGAHTILDRLIEFWILTGIGLIAAYYLGIKSYKLDKERRNRK